MSQCAWPCCLSLATNKCSACHKDRYCSGECQKSDWKEHKLICNTLKTLSNDLQPYHQVVDVIKTILQEAGNVRILEHLLCYAKFQFGQPIADEIHRERVSGESIDNWTVDMMTMIPIYDRLINTHRNNKSLPLIDFDSITLQLNEKMVEILIPWLDLDMDDTHTCMNYILWWLSQTEGNMSVIYGNRSEFVTAANCCQRALTYAKQYNEEGEKKTTLLFASLSNYINVHGLQSDFEGATKFAEEAYNVVAIAYNPVHPQVQEAASRLIECLSHSRDLRHAETFAQMSLDSLKDPANNVDQEGEEVARGYYDLGNIIHSQGNDNPRAEMLAKESLRIRVQFYGNDHLRVGESIALLANTLIAQGRLDDELRGLYERGLAIMVKHVGLDAINTAVGNLQLGQFHYKVAGIQQSEAMFLERLRLSEFYYKEAVRIFTKVYGPTHDSTIRATTYLSQVIHILSPG
jgi:tetratricopeptide (TPR) repeat protein